MKEEEILDSYAWGWELSNKEASFPKWFKTEAEKQACLLGYTDKDTGVTRDKWEILKEIRERIK